ncbi:MAG: hypothetical protein ACKN83_03990 [Vulcanococcus sp.]
MSASLLLLLSSLSLQMAVLHSRRIQATAGDRQQVDDALVSAAHQLAAALTGPYNCLRPLPLSSWQVGAVAPAGCPLGLDAQRLLQSVQGGQVVRLQGWQPTPEGGQMVLQVGQSGPQRRFALTLVPVGALREVG